MTLEKLSQMNYLAQIEENQHAQDLTIEEGFLGLIATARRYCQDNGA